MSPIIAIVGRPNVGKSTLFNRLSKSRDALVDNQPGVTRDRIYAQVHYEGFPLTFVDTGGFDDLRQDPLLGKVRVQVEKAITDADRIIFMVDGRQGIMPADEEIAGILRRSQKGVLLAVNKADGPEHEHMIHDFYKLGFKSVHAISAGNGYGIRSFMDNVIKGLPKSEIRKGDDNQIRVAILGRPNVGKSSLINQILGSDRMVVSELPGTTRDTVDTLFHYHGNEYLLIDTAGIRRKARVRERVDKFSMIKAIGSLKRCHVATILLDAEQGVSEQDARICGYAFEQGKGVILAVNKWDLMKGNAWERKSLNDAIERKLRFVSFAPRINISALTGERVMKLFEKIDLLYEQFSRRISTPDVNSAVQQMIEKHPPPKIGRGRLKLFYATQTGTKPPTFVVFVNRPDMIHFSYERFLINQLREHFRLDLTPVKLRFQER